MNSLIYFIFGVIAGGLGVWVFTRGMSGKSLSAVQDKKESLIELQTKEKEKNKQGILEILKTQTPLTNNHIEQLLGISDATATRYLEELEKEGRVRQVGKTGRYVYYERV